MKVVVAHNRYSSAQPSGENVMVDAEIEQLREIGVEVIPFIRSSDEIATMSPGRRLMLAASPIWARRTQEDLRALLETERPDVFHLHNPYPLLSPWVVRTAHAVGVPVVQTIHNYRHVCMAATFLRDGQLCRDCAGRRVPLPGVRYACYRGSRAQSAIMATSLAVHRNTWRSVDRYIALTAAIANYLRELGIPEERITIKPNAVADPGPPPAAGLGEGVVFAGRLTAEKGVMLLLEAWSTFPEGELGSLRILGDGPLRGAVIDAAGQRNDVFFLGATDSAGVRQAMRSAALVVAPSTWEDVLPTVVIEALANGRPVLGTSLGGLPYLIGTYSDEPAGWVVEPTVEALAAGLKTGLAEAAGLEKAARERYLATFSPEVVLDGLISAYNLARAGR